MFPILALMLLAQDKPWYELPGVDAGFTGVWRDRDGKVITWLAPRTLTFHDGLNHHVVFNLYQVPDGRVRGQWISGTRLEQPPSSMSDNSKANAYADWASLDRDNFLKLAYPQAIEDDWPYPYTVLSGARLNQAYIRFGTPNTAGIINSLFLDFYDLRGTLSQSRQYFYLGPIAQIAVKGSFEGDQVKMDLDFAPADRRLPAFRGTLTVAERTFPINGRFIGARGSFFALNPTTGAVSLRGYLEWTPTEKWARNLTKDQQFTTDRLTVRFFTSGFPNGKSATLLIK